MSYRAIRSHCVLLALATLTLQACGGSDPSTGYAGVESPSGDSSGASGVGGSTGATNDTMGATGSDTAGPASTTGADTTSGPASTTGADATSGTASATTGADGTTGSGGMSGTVTTTGTTPDVTTTGGGVGGGSSTTGDGSVTTDSGATTGGTMMDPGPSSGCGSPAGLESGRLSIDVNGTEREFIIKVPDGYDPSTPYRLVFGWHQLAGSADMIANMGYYGVEGPSNGQAILVSPQGLYQITPSSGNLDAGWWNNDGEDVDFYMAMLDLIRSQLCIDEERIFSIGFSYGAMFSFTLACTPGTKMRAIAPQAGSLFGSCGADREIAIMGFVGTDDSLLSGQRSGVAAFADMDGCSTQTTAVSPSWCDELSSNYLPCSCVEYQGCDAGYPVVSCEYKNGHMFAPNSGQVIWDFFSQF